MTFWLRLSFLSSLITPALIASSCTNLSSKKDVLDGKDGSLILAYEKARSFEESDPMGACSLYTRLATENFVLKDLANIRSHLTCPDPETLPPVAANILDQSPWLAKLEHDRQITEAQKKDDSRALAYVYLKKAQWSDRVRDKIQLLQLAEATYQKVPAKSRSKEDTAILEDIQGRLYRLAPRFLPAPTTKDYFRVATDLIYQRQFTKGRDFLSKIMDGKEFSSEEKYQAHRAYRNSFKTEQKKEQHVNEAEKFALWTSAPKNHQVPQRIHEAYLTWARAAWTQSQIIEAKGALDRAEKLLRGKVLLEEIYFVRAKMAEEAKDLDLSLQLLAKGEKETKLSSPYRSRILFSKAWILRKQGKYQDAVDSFAKLKAETQDPFDKNKYSFWLAKSMKQAMQIEPAQRELQELVQADPLGYYGLVAYREMNTEIPALQLENSKASGWNKPGNVSQQDHDLIRALTLVNESEILEKLLDQKSLDLKNQTSKNMEQDSERWLYFLKAYARAGLFNPLFQQLGSLPTDLKSKLLAQNPELLFPRKYLDLIQASADKFQVKSELILSIIRQESAFNPLARSPADALGLMQVIPSVAHDQEPKTGLKLEHFEDLYKPEINIPVGAALLQALGKKYRGQFVLTAAAYNANERAIEGWLKTRLNEDPLEFIEDVPYEETRAYIKLVLRNFIFYSRLAKPGQAVAFPNWCLEDLQSFKVSTR